MENWTVDQKERALIAREAAIAVLRAEQVQLIADLDRAQVATADGARSMVEWVTARCDVTPGTARDLVAAAKLLADRPELAAEVGAGRVSFDRALATARLAAAGVSPVVLQASRGHDVAGVHRLAAAHRRMTPKDEQQAFAGRHLHLQPSLDRSHWRMWGELPGVDGETVDAVLAHVADQMPDLPDGTRPGLGQRRADALVSVCDQATDQPAGDLERRPLTVAVFVDADLASRTGAEAGVATASGVRIGPEALQQILCDAGIQLTALRDGRPVMEYRRARTTSRRLRRYVHWRDDGMCAVDGSNPTTSCRDLKAERTIPTAWRSSAGSTTTHGRRWGWGPIAAEEDGVGAPSGQQASSSTATATASTPNPHPNAGDPSAPNPTTPDLRRRWGDLRIFPRPSGGSTPEPAAPGEWGQRITSAARGIPARPITSGAPARPSRDEPRPLDSPGHRRSAGTGGSTVNRLWPERARAQGAGATRRTRRSPACRGRTPGACGSARPR